LVTTLINACCGLLGAVSLIASSPVDVPAEGEAVSEIVQDCPGLRDEPQLFV